MEETKYQLLHPGAEDLVLLLAETLFQINCPVCGAKICRASKRFRKIWDTPPRPSPWTSTGTFPGKCSSTAPANWSHSSRISTKKFPLLRREPRCRINCIKQVNTVQRVNKGKKSTLCQIRVAGTIPFVRKNELIHLKKVKTSAKKGPQGA